MKKIFGIFALMMLCASLSFAQTKTVRKIQAGREYPDVIKNWKDNALKTARENNKIERQRAKDNRQNERFLSKLERIKARNPKRKNSLSAKN